MAVKMKLIVFTLQSAVKRINSLVAMEHAFQIHFNVIRQQTVSMDLMKVNIVAVQNVVMINFVVRHRDVVYHKSGNVMGVCVYSTQLSVFGSFHFVII